MHKRTFATILLGTALMALFAVSAARADNIYAKIRGAITDQSGAVVVGAKVTATNVATGVSYTVTSETDGIYEFLQLPAPGTYDVKAEQGGFRPYEAQNIPLVPGDPDLAPVVMLEEVRFGILTVIEEETCAELLY